MRVALFGFYKYGNFGDDLMAVMFGRKFERDGVSFRMFGDPAGFAREFGFDASDSVETLLEGADVVVYGGGGAFLDVDWRSYQSEIDKLCELCEKRGIPIVMISVGGDGRGAGELTSACQRLLRQAKFISFRNEGELGLASGLAGEYRCHPDVVWALDSFFDPRVKAAELPVVAVDRSITGGRKIRLMLRALAGLCRLAGKDQAIKYYSTSRAASPSADKDTVCYASIEGFLERIFEARLVVTNRLHMGVAAMSRGIPAVLFRPQPKAELLYRQLGADKLIFKGALSILSLAWTLLSRRRFERLLNEFRKIDVGTLSKEAALHMDDLSRQLELLGR